jgi:flagellar assembly protein FliH
MSSRARRVVDVQTVSPFEWGHPRRTSAKGGRQVPALEAAPAPPPVDLAAQQAQLAALERDAFAKGFAQGERAGAEAAAKRGEAMLRRLTETIEELANLRTQMIHQTERQMVNLALSVARRIVHREVSIDQDLLLAMARVALQRLGDSAVVTVRLHPEEHAATVGQQTEQFTGTNVTVVADARVPRGGCRIESDFGAMDVGVEAQIQEVARALLGDREEAMAHATVDA